MSTEDIKESVIVSACLLGINCRYDGKDAKSLDIDGLLKGRTPLPVCPEELGGLPTPRNKAEINSTTGDGTDVLKGKAWVIDDTGLDVTAEFLRGAEKVLKAAEAKGVKVALLKEGSPSCGVNAVSKDGKKVSGVGVTTAMLKEAGIATYGLD